MKKRVGIWIRVSTEDQAQGDSPKHHEHRAKAYAEVKGWLVVEEYHLEAVSGKSVMSHPEAKRMIEDIKSGHITGLIFSKLARLARNTRELLEFADIFREHNADLMSLDESIDTSSPAGRFFYTLIAGMAEWERAEIGSRVKASVATRAKLGKPLGGEAPYGYRWENKELVLDPEEAPVRKLVHELFAKEKRKRTVAQILNDQGYKTRHGKFSDTSVDRMLRDPIAKGMRRVNYTESLGDGKHWKMKPKEDWVFIKAPRIISDELWDSCNRILDEMNKNKDKVRRKGVHLFSGILECACGAKMYMRSNSPKYVCPNCKNKVDPNDLEEIFHGQLEKFLFSDTEIQGHLDKEKLLLKDKEELLETRRKEYQKLKHKVDNIFELYHEGQISKDAFKEQHTPIYNAQCQVEVSMTELQGQIDALRMQSLDNVQVLSDAQNLHKQWYTFTQEEKKAIIEAITSSIVAGREDISINLSYIPTLTNESTNSINLSIQNSSVSQNNTTMQRTLRVALHSCQIQLQAKKPGNPAYPAELNTLGDHLRKVRLERGLSQPQVAEALKVTTDTVTYWETNRCEPTAKFAKGIIEFLGYIPFNESGSIGKQLYLARMVSGKTQKEAAQIIGCDTSNLRRLELGEQKPFRKTREKIEVFVRAALVG